MATIANCPSPTEWELLLRGDFSCLETEPLAQHLEECELCAATVEKLQVEDTLADQLRLGNPSEVQPSTALIQSLIEQFSQIVPGDKTESGGEDAATPSTIDPVFAASIVPEATGAESAFLAPAQRSDELGRLGRYRVLKVLGEGGMGVVFQAEDPDLERLVALKVMKPEAAARAGAKERFLREARATAKIDHDHIVSIYEVGDDHGVPYFAMPMLRGRSLDKSLKRGDPIPVRHILRIGRQVALGLDAAHKHGLIHRDIKPGNVWLEEETLRVKILDFGLALPSNEQTNLTQSGVVMGTPNFMAPEQAAGDHVDHRADLFSLGCILYRLCTGRQPFQGKDIMATLTALAISTPKPIRNLNSAVPGELAELVMSMLEKDPARRPASAKGVAQELHNIELNLAPNADRSTTEVPTPPVSAYAAPIVEPMTQVDPFAGIDESAELTPMPPRKSSRSTWTGPIALAACSVLIAGGTWLAATLLKVESPEGTLVIEVEGDEVEATIKGKKVVITDKVSKRVYELSLEGKDSKMGLPPSDYEIAVTDDSGLKLKVREFEIVKGKTSAVRVTMQPAVAKRQTDEPAKTNPSATKTDPVVAKGGVVILKPKATLPLRGIEMRWLTISRDGKTLAIASPGIDLILWDLEAKKRKRGIGEKGDFYETVEFSPDGSTVAAGTQDGTVRILNTENGNLIQTFKGNPGYVTSLAFSSKGTWLAVGGGRAVVRGEGENAVRLFQMPEGKEGPVLNGHMSQVTSVEFSADDKHLITGSLDKSVRIWKLDTDELLNTLIGFPGGVRSAKFAPSGKQVAAASEDEISFWDPFKPEKLRSVSLETEKKRVHCVCYSPDGKILATADADFCIQLLDAETGKVRAVLKGHEKAVWYVTFAPDGTTLVSGGSDGVVKTWDVSAFSGPISK